MLFQTIKTRLLNFLIILWTTSHCALEGFIICSTTSTAYGRRPIKSATTSSLFGPSQKYNNQRTWISDFSQIHSGDKLITYLYTLVCVFCVCVLLCQRQRKRKHVHTYVVAVVAMSLVWYVFVLRDLSINVIKPSDVLRTSFAWSKKLIWITP